jgi:hypothetical protein
MAKLKKNPYIRVGTEYYKFVEQVLFSGDITIKLKIWKYSTIKQDELPELIRDIPKYDDFTIVPDHLNYNQVINNLYNRYEPFEHTPVPGNCEKTLTFIRHIFGEQFELGLDYLKILLEKPVQHLPVLCLVSTERNTGKTTFLNWLKAVFKGNMTLNTNEDFRSRFNVDWANKLIIGIEEVLLEKKEDSERIKNLSTAKIYKAEAKGVDKVEIPFFGKFILCSNNTDNFIKIDSGETRYWIRDVPPLQNDNINLLKEMIQEIPAFLNYLINRKYSTSNRSRMWFTPDQIRTEALVKVIRGNQTSLEKELREIIKETMLNYDLEEIHFTATDLFDLVKNSIRTSRNHVTETIRNRFNLKNIPKPSTYKSYHMTMNPQDDSEMVSYITKKGRYYTFSRDMFED